MGLLKPCQKIIGARERRAGTPPIELHRDVVSTPGNADPKQGWGLFNQAGQLIPASGYHRGPVRHLPMQSDRTTLDCARVQIEAPDRLYIYGGAVHPHYGHFLLSTLSRLWAQSHGLYKGVKIVWHSHAQPCEWFKLSHFRVLLSALGLSDADFVVFSEPTRLRRILIPTASFEEMQHCYDVFGTMCRSIGDRLTQPEIPRSEPVYISKSRLRSGVSRVDNEEALTDHLEKRGVRIVFPEQMSIPNQIGLFNDHSCVLGWVGSGLHTSVLGRKGAKIIALAYDDQIVSNFPMIDSVAGNIASYFSADTSVDVIGKSDSFSMLVRLNRPEEVGDELLRLVERRGRAYREIAAKSERGRPLMKPASLDEIGVKHGTDKSSLHHDFLELYESFLRPLQESPAIVVLEIGVYEGASARMWEEHFENARIIAVDVNPAAKLHQSGRIEIVIANQGDVDDLVTVCRNFGPFDLIVDDGSHFWDDQITTFRYTYPFLRAGGFYILEDLDTSYGSFASDYRGLAYESAAGYLKRFSDCMIADRALDLSSQPNAFIRTYAPRTEFVTLSRRTSIIKKRLVRS